MDASTTTTTTTTTHDIQLIDENDSELTLLIDGGQAMQTWERELMYRSADIMTSYGSRFLEAGLGLGLSAVRIAAQPTTKRHVVVELHQRVIDLFLARQAAIPDTLDIVRADFFEYVKTLEAAALDGIFFDPYLPQPVWDDPSVWQASMPWIVRALRPGGVFIPCFSTRPVLKWQFVPFFKHVLMERSTYAAYASTRYTPERSGDAYVQCFIND